MNGTFLVATREFRQRVRSRGFVIQLILTPLVFVAIAFFAGISMPEAPVATSSSQEEETVGYVDNAGIIQTAQDSLPGPIVRRFADEASAAAALDRGEIAAYYVIAQDYRTSGDVRWVGAELPIVPPNTAWFEDLLAENVVANADATVQAHLRRPFHAAEVPVIQPEPGPDIADSERLNWVPFLASLLVLIPLFTAGGYLFQGLVQEKSNRVMELLLVSLSPKSLLSGKMLGLGLLVLVLYMAWSLVGLGVVMLADLADAPRPVFSDIQLSGTEILFVILYALGAYMIYAALMAGIGAVTASIENNRMWIFVLTLPMLLPIYLWSAIVADPNGALAVVLSIFPLSAPVAMLMRLTVTTVPLWQIGGSLVLVFLTALAVVWLMARLFRAHTLLSGESWSPKRVWLALSEQS